MDWLRQLIESLAAVQLAEQHQPMDEVKEGETVVGTISDELKRLYTFICITHAALTEKCERDHPRIQELQARPRSTWSDEERMFCDLHRIEHDEYDRLEDLFWHSVKKEHPSTAAYRPGFDMRKDWQVALLSPDECSGCSGCEHSGIIVVTGSILPNRPGGLFRRIFGFG